MTWAAGLCGRSIVERMQRPTVRLASTIASTVACTAAQAAGRRGNVTDAIAAKVSRKLLNDPCSPLHHLWAQVKAHFAAHHPAFAHFQDDQPVVTVRQNFDELLFPADHPGRSAHDSYFLDEQRMLRTHMTANERAIMAEGVRRFIVAGDVYRRDAIDCTHMPVFHQLEGVSIFTPDELAAGTQQPPLPEGLEELIAGQEVPAGASRDAVRLVMGDLHGTLSRLMAALFGEAVPMRWSATTFPFTTPSMEAEVFYNGQWLEVVGSGVLRAPILPPSVPAGSLAWAFGMGLERVAMVLHAIPDIRLFWSQDARWRAQFAPPSGGAHGRAWERRRFVPFSKYPPIGRDVSFYVDEAVAAFAENDLFDLIRSHADDLVESVEKIDEFVDGRGRSSRCYRITFRSMDKTLTDAQVNAIQDAIRASIASSLPGVTLR